MWALADESQRREIEAAHAAAVNATIAHLTDTVPTIRRRSHGQVFEEAAQDVVAAEYRHTTARGVLETDAPDPQLHSHVVITSAVRDNGKIVAVASRPIFRSARELGAHYRSALAHQLQQRGYAIEAGTGKHGRYFEIAGVPRGLLDAFSSRSREVRQGRRALPREVGPRTRARRARQLKLENRKAKTLITRADLEQAWNDTAARYGFAGEQPGRLPGAAMKKTREGALEDRVEQGLTEQAATFEPGEFRAVLLEQSVGELSPGEALDLSTPRSPRSASTTASSRSGARRRRATRSTAHSTARRRADPRRRREGLVLTESAAILLYLGDRPRGAARAGRPRRLLPLARLPHEHGPDHDAAALLSGAVRRRRGRRRRRARRRGGAFDILDRALEGRTGSPPSTAPAPTSSSSCSRAGARRLEPAAWDRPNLRRHFLATLALPGVARWSRSRGSTCPTGPEP